MHERQSSGSNCARIGLSQRRADCNQVISASAMARKDVLAQFSGVTFS